MKDKASITTWISKIYGFQGVLNPGHIPVYASDINQYIFKFNILKVECEYIYL